MQNLKKNQPTNTHDVFVGTTAIYNVKYKHEYVCMDVCTMLYTYLHTYVLSGKEKIGTTKHTQLK